MPSPDLAQSQHCAIFPQPAWQFEPTIKPCSWTWDFSRELSLQAAFFLTFWCCDLDRVHSQHWPCSPGFLPAHPTLSLSLAFSLSKLPFPSSGIWAALWGPPNLEATLTTHREFTPPQCASNHHPTLANQPSRSSLGEPSKHTEPWSHSLISSKS
jgi:hypothetical protein